jgi:hypothetical protein
MIRGSVHNVVSTPGGACNPKIKKECPRVRFPNGKKYHATLAVPVYEVFSP